MKIQAADGRLHHITGKKLPDSIDLYSGVPYSGAHLAEVLLNPKDAKATPLSTATGWISKRDAIMVAIGFFFFRLLAVLAEAAALSLT